MAKLVGSIAALIIAFVFTFVFPGSGFEQTLIVIAASIAGQIGLTSWRTDFDLINGWMKSKTIVGALIVVIPAIIVVLLPFVWAAAPAWVLYVLGAISVGGGGTVIVGILNAPSTSAEVK
jgi:hypothetical protein